MIMCFWDDEDVKVSDVSEARRAFFVRVDVAKEKEAIDTFKSVRVIEADVEGEFAFVTDVMSEKEFNEKADEVGIISRIRMEA